LRWRIARTIYLAVDWLRTVNSKTFCNLGPRIIPLLELRVAVSESMSVYAMAPLILAQAHCRGGKYRGRKME
jgi:hypothetical protein